MCGLGAGRGPLSGSTIRTPTEFKLELEMTGFTSTTFTHFCFRILTLSFNAPPGSLQNDRFVYVSNSATVLLSEMLF